VPSLPAPILALGPDWHALYAAASTADQRALVETLAARALADIGPAASVDAVPELATDAEVSTLAGFLEALYSRARGPSDPYERHKQRTAQRERDKSSAGREIGPLPPVKDPDRRAACERNLELYLTCYHPRAFPKRFSTGHRTMIGRIQIAVLIGALFAFAIDRGRGKTTVTTRGVLWSQIYRHHLFAMLLGATDEKAQKCLLAIKTELRFNPQLADDFPEVCYPIYRLEGINQRAKGQLLDGAPTNIVWTDNEIVLPTVAGRPGAIIGVGGLLTAVRGAQHTTETGEIIRPGVVMIDDPQTRESATSVDQSGTRLEIINGDVLGMAGPGQPLAVVIPCTIIRRGDTADQLTDRELFPDFQGKREGIVDKLPDDLPAWQDYFEILDRIKTIPDDQPELLAGIRAEATAHYCAHREQLDAGCVASWPERKLDWEASAIQHAMNLYRRDEAAFWCEYMNAPLDPFASEDEFLQADAIGKLFSGYARGKVPLSCTWLTAFVDVQNRCLYWAVCAWEPNFTGYVIDYGCFPDQKRPTWKATKAEHTLKMKYPNRSTEAAIYAGLQELAAELLDRQWKRDDGGPLKIALCLVDAADKTTTVRKAVRESTRSDRLLPSIGRHIGPNMRPISSYKTQTGEVIGDEWMIRPGRGRRGREVRADVDHWKTFLQRRLATPRGDRGSLTLYGRDGARPHAFLARHLTAELRERVVGDRPVDHWKMKPGESENHWLDCLTGCCVAASICGSQISGAEIPRRHSRRSGKKRAATYLNP
jgi:hypothetical protein